MRNIRKSILRGASILGLVLSAASTSSAMNASSGNPQVMAWRMVARKNFVEGFCVAQNLNAQGIVIQPNQQVDQAAVNAFKNAVAVCKLGNKNVAPPQGTVSAAPVAPVVPVAPAAPVAPVSPVPSPIVN